MYKWNWKNNIVFLVFFQNYNFEFTGSYAHIPTVFDIANIKIWQ